MCPIDDTKFCMQLFNDDVKPVLIMPSSIKHIETLKNIIKFLNTLPMQKILTFCLRFFDFNWLKPTTFIFSP